MLIKLIKYNLRAIFKAILPFIIALLACVIFFNLTDYDIEYVFDENQDVHEIFTPAFAPPLHGLAQTCLYCAIILLVASTLRAIWSRFHTNFYSDEAYLTHTLPVSRMTLWNAQVCSMLITFASIFIFFVLNCFILLLTHGGQVFLDSLGLLGGCVRCVGEYYSIEPQRFSFYLALTLIFLAEFIFMTFCGYTGIILKNRLNKNITSLSGVALYLLGGSIIACITLTLFSDIFLHNDIIPNGPNVHPDAAIDRVIAYIGFIYTCFSVGLYFVDRKLLHRGINLD